MRTTILCIIAAANLLSACGTAQSSASAALEEDSQRASPARAPEPAKPSTLSRASAVALIKHARDIQALLSSRPLAVTLRPNQAISAGLLISRTENRRDEGASNIHRREVFQEVGEYVLTHDGVKHLSLTKTTAGTRVPAPDENRVIERVFGAETSGYSRTRQIVPVDQQLAGRSQIPTFWQWSLRAVARTELSSLNVTGIADGQGGTKDVEFELTLNRRLPEALEKCGCVDVSPTAGTDAWLGEAIATGTAECRRYDDGWRIVRIRLSEPGSTLSQ